MYLFDNELFAIECVAKYAMEGLVVDSSNGQFAHCPYPKPKGQKKRLAGDLGYWLTFEDHQHQGLLQSVDFDRRCFFAGDAQHWLDTKPPGYEELYVIFKHYISGEHNPLKGRVGELHPAFKSRFKPVTVIKPDGTKLHFASISEAARELPIPRRSLSRYVKDGCEPTRAKFKNYQFFYAVKE